MKITTDSIFLKFSLLSFLCFLFASPVISNNEKTTRIIYVNNISGSDEFDGSLQKPDDSGKHGPFKSINQAFAAASTSCRIEIANTGKPYHGGIGWGKNKPKSGGTAEKPLVINGNGAFVSGLGPVAPEKWKSVDGRIFSTKFIPMSNMLKRHKPIQHWLDRPRIWWVNGEPAPNCKNERELRETPGGFFWNKSKWSLWFHLPEGNKIEDLDIQIPMHNTCVNVSANFVTVKNLRAAFSWNDGFDTSGGGQNIVFQNCIATDNCGQGFSTHGATGALYEDCLAERCASSGACDVHFSNTTFRRCVFVDNTFEAGVYAVNHSHNVFRDCLIAGNSPFEQIWQKGNSTMNFHNCVIMGRKDNPHGLLLMENGKVLFSQCTLADAPFVTRISKESAGILTVENCLITRCSKFAFEFPLNPNRFTLNSNVYWDSPGNIVQGEVYGMKRWKEYQKALKGDNNSKWLNPELTGELKISIPKGSLLLKQGLYNKRPCRVGAKLPKSVWDLYMRTRNEYPTPSGIIKK